MKLLVCLLAILLMSGCKVVSLSPESAGAEMPEMLQDTAVQDEQTGVHGQSDAGYVPVTLLSLGELSVRVTGYSPDNTWGPSLQLELRNETEHELSYGITYAKTDGVMCNPYWSCTVPAGDTVQSQVWWSRELMEKSGIRTLGELVMELTICHSGDPNVVLYDDAVALSLRAGETEPADLLTRDEFGGQLLVENEEITIAAVGFWQQADEAVLTLCLDNPTSNQWLCTATDVLVDGEACDPQWGAVVMQDSRLYSELVWKQTEPAEGVSMMVTVYNNEDWTADTVVSQYVTVNIG